MSGQSKVAVGISASSLALIVLLAWVTWSKVLSPVDRVFILTFLGIGSFGGQ